MRLIDADALAGEFLTVCRSEFEIKHKCMTDYYVLHLIHNAPTVEQSDFKEGYKQAIIDGKTNYSRPQGRWIECTKSGMPLTEYGRMTGEKWYGFKCSQCKHIYKGNALIESPYCQKCGADMRGEEE